MKEVKITHTQLLRTFRVTKFDKLNNLVYAVCLETQAERTSPNRQLECTNLSEL